MLLAIDAGNTNIVFALVDSAGTCRYRWRCATQRERTADEYAVWLLGAMAVAGLDRSAVTDAVFASVVPNVDHNLRQLCRHFFGCEPLNVGDGGLHLDVSIRVSAPGEVGADRLVNALGAHLGHGGSLIVVDFGTATTFDIVGADGAYDGGIIAPGVTLSQEALHRAAAKLPRVDVAAPDSVIGGSTVAAMRSGIFYGYLALVEGLVARIKNEYGQPMQVIATGGLAGLFTPATPVIEHHDPDLTLRGLADVYRRNRQRA